MRQADALKPVSLQCIAGIVDFLSPGNNLLTTFPIPFLFGVVCVEPGRGEITPVCSLLLPHVFPNISRPPFPSSQAAFQVGWHSAAHSYRLSRKLVSSVQKNMFWPPVPHLEGYLPLRQFCSLATLHNTLDRFCLHTRQKQNIFCLNESKKKRSCISIVRDILLRALDLELLNDQNGAIFSHSIQKQKVTLWQL